MAKSNDEITELIKRMHESGALGRSSTYPRLLDYLVEKTRLGQSCSEVDLAENVFFKNDTFDQTTDSSVRVYVHNLRKKLQLYYENEGSVEAQRVHIPKGEYRAEILDAEQYARALEGKSAKAHIMSGLQIQGDKRSGKYTLWAGLAVLCVLMAIIGVSVQVSQQPSQIEYSEEQLAFWGGILSDNKPVRILLDNATGRFGIQSQSISSVLSAQGGGQSQTGIQAEVPDLLIRLVTLLEGVDRPVEIGYLSEFSAEDFRGESHIVYTDHIDGITKLAAIVGDLEQLQPADLAPILLEQQAKILHSSAISAGDPRANDYGLILSESLQFSDSEPFELVLLAGYGFAGQSAVVQIAQSKEVLTEMQLTESEAISRGLSAIFQVTVSDGFLPERILISSEIH